MDFITYYQFFLSLQTIGFLSKTIVRIQDTETIVSGRDMSPDSTVSSGVPPLLFRWNEPDAELSWDSLYIDSLYILSPQKGRAFIKDCESRLCMPVVRNVYSPFFLKH